MKLFGKETECWYKGNLENGIPTGQGEYHNDNESIYSGEFKNGKLNGKGIQIIGEYRYEGNFIDNELTGYGKLFTNGKLQYEGEFVNTVENGEGKFYEIDGSVFEGTFENGYYKKGILKSMHGYEADGIWKEFELISGTVKYEDGRVYSGELKNWKPNGKGKMVYPNGQVEEGLWKKGKYKN